MSAVKIAVVTGSTDGLGRVAATMLARDGYRVWVHGRDVLRGETLVRQIAAQGGEARFLRADFGSLGEVRAFATHLLHELPALDLLINNAGIGPHSPGGCRGRELSADGYELRWAVNYLAGFLLTHMLLPALERAAPARIVNVSSLGQFPLDFSNLMLERAYSGMRAYAQSKLAQVLFTFDLARALRLRGVTVNALHPATFMDTTMVRAMNVEPRSTVAAGAAALMHLACAPEHSGTSGEFFDGMSRARAHAQAYDLQAQQRLAAISERLTGLVANPASAAT